MHLPNRLDDYRALGEYLVRPPDMVFYPISKGWSSKVEPHLGLDL